MREPRPVKTEPAYQPDEDEKEIIRLVNERINFTTRESARWALERQMFETIAFSAGIQWLEYTESTRKFSRWNAPAWFPTPVQNEMKPRLQSMTARILRSRPQARVRPDTNDPKDREGARVGEKFVGHFDDVTFEDEKRQEAAVIAGLTGTVIAEDFWNPNAGPIMVIPRQQPQQMPVTEPAAVCPQCQTDGDIAQVGQLCPTCSTQMDRGERPRMGPTGQPLTQTQWVPVLGEDGQPIIDEVRQGEIETRMRMLFNFFHDPKATNLRESRWAGDAQYADLDWIDENFPDKGPYVAEESGIDASNFYESSLLALIGPSIQGTAHYGGSSLYRNGAVVRRYQEKPSKKRPHGLYAVVANNVLLYRGPLPITDTNGIPTGDLTYTEFKYDLVPGRFAGCYDEQTEILTRRGWLPFRALENNDEVATRNTETKHFEWQVPSRLIDAPYEGDLYHFRSASVDLAVTPNHRMLVTRWPYRLGGSSKRKGECLLRADVLGAYTNSKVGIPMTSKWSGVEIRERRFERNAESQSAARAVGENKASDQPTDWSQSYAETVVMSGDDYCAFMGAYLSEGWVGSYTVHISQMEKSKGYGPFGQLVARILGKPARHDGKDFVLNRVALRDHCATFGHSHQKYIPDDILNASPRQLRLFWDHYVLGDGCRQVQKSVSGRGTHPRVREEITTTSAQMAGQLQEIAQKLGWSASVRRRSNNRASKIGDRGFGVCRDAYQVRVRYSDSKSFRVERTPYRGRVYCVTVPNGVVYVRRNGMPAWCGNSTPAEDMVPLQRQVNGITAQKIINRKTLMNPWVLAPKGCGLNPGQVAMRPAATVAYNPVMGLKPEVIPGTPLPEQVDKEKADCITAMDRLAQDARVGHGEMPAGVKSGVALNFLKEQGDEASAPRLQRWGQWIAERNRKRLLLAQRYYKEPRAVKIGGPGSEWQVRLFMGADLHGQTDVSVDPGSLMPRSQAARQQLMMDAIENKIIDLGDQFQRQRVIEELGLTQFETAIGPDRRRAQKENATMDEGIPVAVNPTDNTQVHIVEHTMAMQDPAFDSKPDMVKAQYQQHLQAHQQQQQVEQQAALQQAAQEQQAGIDQHPQKPEHRKRQAHAA